MQTGTITENTKRVQAMEPDFLPGEITRLLGISIRTFYKMAGEGNIPGAYKFKTGEGKQGQPLFAWRVRRQQFMEYYKALSVAPCAESSCA